MTTRCVTGLVLAAFMLGGGAAAQDTVTVPLGTTGEGAPFSTRQPSLALSPLIALEGEFGAIGEVKWFAGTYAPSGYAFADGQLLSIASNQVLFSRIGTTFGGDGRSTFALPDLRARSAIGFGGSFALGDVVGQPETTLTEANLPPHDHGTATGPSSTTGSAAPFDNRQQSVALSFEIAANGIYPSQNAQPPGGGDQPSGGNALSDAFIASIGMFADADRFQSRLAFSAADGSVLPIAQNTALFSLIGSTYGGDGRTNFQLPDTRDRVIVGTGNGAGLSVRQLGATGGTAFETLTLGQMPFHSHDDPDFGTTDGAGGALAVNNLEPELALNYAIALQGIFPSRSSREPSFGPTPQPALGTQPFLGEIALFAGNFAPRGWALAQGQILPIAQNQALFAIIGTLYGGDGRTTFALPDLRGRTPVGAGANLIPGQRLGTETTFLSLANLPAHGHTISRAVPPIPVPAGIWLLAGGLAALAIHGRRRA